MNERHALYFGLSAVGLWSTVATAFKLTLAQFTPIQMLTIACIVSSAALFVICAQQHKLHQLTPTFLTNPRYFMLSGLINPFSYYLILFKAYDLLPAAQAQAINYSWAITLTMMAAVFLKQRIRTQDYIAAGICYLGVIIIATQGNVLALQFKSPVGVGLALLSTLLWSAYWILNTKNKADPVISVLLGFLVATPCIIGLAIYETMMDPQVSWSEPSLFGWFSAIYVGLFEMGITFFLWLSALRRTHNTARISNLIFISPFISLILLAAIIHETIHPSTLMGLVAIIIGLAIQQSRRKT